MQQMTSASAPAKTTSQSVKKETPQFTPDVRLRPQVEGIVRGTAEREIDELVLPISDSQDLKVNLRQIKSAYKQGRFVSRLRTATKNLHSYLQRSEKDGTREYWRAGIL